MNVSNPTRQALDGLSLGDIVARLWRGKWFIVLVSLGFVAFFGYVAFTSRPMFRTTVWMTPADSERMGSIGAALGSFANIASMIGIDVGPGGSLQTQESLAVLQSREFREAFINDLNLMPELFAEQWDPEQARWRGREPDMMDAMLRLNEIVITGRNQKTGLYSVQVEWTDPRKAAAWANTLVVRLNTEMRRRALHRSSAFITYLEKELAATAAVQTRDAVAQVLSAQINERMLATVTEEYAFKVVEHAPVPDRKFWPRRGLMLMAGGLAGGLMSSVLVLFGPTMRRNFNDALRASGV